MMLATKPLNVTRVVAMRATSGRVASKARRSMVVRATTEEPKTEDGTVFYGGQTFASEEEFKSAVASGQVTQAAPPPTPKPAAAPPALGFGDIMAFSGPGPELINGRLAMLGFVAALFAEISSGESVLVQWASEPTGVALAFFTFAVASLIPLLSSTKREAFGIFRPEAEVLNGRAAMIGFAALIAVEAVKGSALF